VFGDAADGNTAGDGSGGAIFLSGSTLNADNCTFHHNRATQNGGALAAYTSTVTINATYATALAATHAERLESGMPQSTGCDPLAGQCSALYGNVADSDTNNSGDGGAIYTNDSTLSMNYTYLHRNRARAGGAISQDGLNATAAVSNSLIYSNTSTAGLGAGIRVQSGAFTVTHVTLAYNAGASGYSLAASGSGAAHNSLAWGNDTGFYLYGGSTFTSTCTIDQSGNAGPATNPQFVAPGAGEDYHLHGSSPAVNACATGMARDLDNVARPFGPLFDMGAFELHQYDLYLPLIRR
jgi:predicted outer membrane repeat protein